MLLFSLNVRLEMGKLVVINFLIFISFILVFILSHGRQQLEYVTNSNQTSLIYDRRSTIIIGSIAKRSISNLLFIYYFAKAFRVFDTKIIS